MVFREVIGEVGGSWALVYAKHLLGFLASYPEEAHVPRLASLAQHVFVTYTVRGGVVRLDGMEGIPEDVPRVLAPRCN